MKKKYLNIQVNEPCHMSWQNMHPLHGSRFCDSCEKEVVDFSEFSDQQLVAFLMNHKGQALCGRFQTSQLNRALPLHQPNSPVLIQRAIGIAVAGLLSIGTVNGQNNASKLHSSASAKVAIEHTIKDDTLLTDLPSGNEQPLPHRAYTGPFLAGLVLDHQDQSPLQGANVAFYKNGVLFNGTGTDENGYYFFPLPDNAAPQDYEVRISYVGYAEQSFSPELSELSTTYLFPGVDLSEIVVVNYKVPLICTVGMLTGITVIQEQLQEEAPEPDYLALPEQPTVKVFPNPFFQQLQVDIHVAETETWTFQLIHMNGQVVFELRQQVMEGRQVLAIDLSHQNLSGGSYVFAVSNASELIFSEVVIRSQGMGYPGNLPSARQ